MSLIIDANRASDFSAPFCGHASNILTRISKNKAKITVGGKLTEELGKTPFRNLLAELTRIGRVIRIKSGDLNAELDRMQGAKFRSNDSHVVVLARVSGARLLYTNDDHLIDDFKNGELLCPRGKIIKTTTSGRVADSLLDRFGT